MSVAASHVGNVVVVAGASVFLNGVQNRVLYATTLMSVDW